MLKAIIVLVLFFYGMAYSQTSTEDLTKSIFYFNATEDNSITKFNYIGLKTLKKDTLIGGQKFNKVLWTKFRDYEKEKSYSWEYEHISEKIFFILDQYLDTLHYFQLTTSNQGAGVLFRNNVAVKGSYLTLDPRGDSVRPEEDTPIQFVGGKDEEFSLTYRPDLKIMELYQQGAEYTKYAIGEVFNELTLGLKNTEPIHSSYELEKGDMVQILYHARSRNTSLPNSQLTKKQLITAIYKGDTIIDGNYNLITFYEDYDFSTGKMEYSKDFYIQVKDSGIFINEQEYFPSIYFKPTFKIAQLNLDEKKLNGMKIPQVYLERFQNEARKEFLIFSAYVLDTIGNHVFPRIIHHQSNSMYSTFILPYFPMVYNSYPGTLGIVSFVKIKGKAYGTMLQTPSSDIKKRRKIKKIR